MGKIRMNYEEMRAAAGDIRTQAQRARDVVAELEGDVRRLLPTWEGASKDAFQSVYALCQSELERVPQMLDQVSQALARTADRIEQAEQQAGSDMQSTVTADEGR